MEKKKKKPGTQAAKNAKAPSDYKARADSSKPSPTDDVFRKAQDKPKDGSRKK